ncbi:Glucose-methanol-choline (GMC) oxidoreductase:NAD binding site, partial [hydrothermal vent metagenome]
MLIDATTIPDGATVDTDVCIVGGGMAGITIARELIGSGQRVVVLESGQTEETPQAQELTQGKSVGEDYFELTETRFRVLGGNSQRWAGWCRPIDPADFEARPWVADSGWPFSADTLAPYFDRAHEVCQVDSPSYELEEVSALVPQLYQPPFVSDDVRAVMWTHSPPTRFGSVYRSELEDAQNTTVHLGATVINLDGTNPKHVPSVTVRTEHTTYVVKANTFILTLGGLETPRLLLTSTDAVESGYGNQNDVVGRYFMEHPHLLCGTVRVDQSGQSRPIVATLDKGLGGIRARMALQRPAGDVKFALALSPELQRKHRLLNGSVHYTVVHHARTESSAIKSLRLVVGNLRSPVRMFRQVRDGAIPGGLGTHVRNILRGIPEVTKVVVNNVLRKPRGIGIFAQAEQSPNRESRVLIDANSVDRYGVPTLVLDWRLRDQDKDSIRRTQELVSEYLVNAGVGPIEPADWLSSDGWGPDLGGGHHHMGTARMGVDPATSVVDANCRIHGSENVYVGDSSVLPSNGFANP